MLADLFAQVIHAPVLPVDIDDALRKRLIRNVHLGVVQKALHEHVANTRKRRVLSRCAQHEGFIRRKRAVLEERIVEMTVSEPLSCDQRDALLRKLSGERAEDADVQILLKEHVLSARVQIGEARRLFPRAAADVEVGVLAHYLILDGLPDHHLVSFALAGIVVALDHDPVLFVPEVLRIGHQEHDGQVRIVRLDGLLVSDDYVRVGLDIARVAAVVLRKGADTQNGVAADRNRPGYTRGRLRRSGGFHRIVFRSARKRIRCVAPFWDVEIHRLYARIDAAFCIRRGLFTIEAASVRSVCGAFRGRIEQLPRAGRVASVRYAGARFRHDRAVDHSAGFVIKIDRFPRRRNVKIEREPSLFIGYIAFGLSFAGKASRKLQDEISFCGDTRSVRKNPFPRLCLVVRYRIPGQVHRRIRPVVQFDPASEIGVVRTHAVGLG